MFRKFFIKYLSLAAFVVGLVSCTDNSSGNNNSRREQNRSEFPIEEVNRLLETGDLDKAEIAIENFFRSRKTSPEDKVVYLGYKTMLLLKKKKYEEALVLIDQAIELSTTEGYRKAFFPTGLLNDKVVCLEHLGRHSEACNQIKNNLRMGVEYDPQEYNFHIECIGIDYIELTDQSE